MLIAGRDACAEGEQAYWVCPVIEESRDGDLQAALDAHEEAAGGRFRGLRLVRLLAELRGEASGLGAQVRDLLLLLLQLSAGAAGQGDEDGEGEKSIHGEMIKYPHFHL